MQRKWMTVSAVLVALSVLACGCDMKKNINAPSPSGAPLCVNEFLASNHTYPDEFSENDDFIEVYNRTDRAIDLAGYGVTDDLTQHTKYVIPSGSPAVTTIPPKGFLLIWCDGQPEQGPLHTGFKLSASGEQIGHARGVEAYYAREFTKATDAFGEALSLMPGDVPAAFYLERSRAFARAARAFQARVQFALAGCDAKTKYQRDDNRRPSSFHA